MARNDRDMPSAPNAAIVDEQTQRAAMGTSAPARPQSPASRTTSPASVRRFEETGAGLPNPETKNITVSATSPASSRRFEETGAGFPNAVVAEWVKAGTVQTADGPVDVDANGFAADGSKPVAKVKPKVVSVYTDEKTGDVIDVYEDGTEEVRKKGTVKLDAQKAAEATAAERLAGKVSAFDILQREFTEKGLGFLVEAARNAIMNEETDAGRILALRSSPAYVQRFSANEQRKLKGLRVLDEASYLAMEDQYQEVMRQYGLPESYYAKDTTGKQVGFEQLIANDVSNLELGDRLMAAQDRVLNANPEVLKALKDFYPDIKNGDILAYTLDPKNAIKDIQRKVTAAEIGGAAMQSGLTTNLARAQELQKMGVDKASATEGYSAIGAGLQRGSELASIYGESPYSQATAESEVFKLTGAQEARKQRQKVTGLEKATFGGQSGLTGGALARDRAGGI